jgi:hypothetical protein
MDPGTENRRRGALSVDSSFNVMNVLFKSTAMSYSFAKALKHGIDTIA